MLGFKGLKKNLMCRDLQYKIGETYVHDGRITLCNSGFHFCKELVSCFTYYPNNGENIFAIVEVPDNCNMLADNDKIVTNTIKIIKILSEKEIIEEINSSMLKKAIQYVKEKYLPIQNAYPDLICLGGSLALILQGYKIEYRDINKSDIDILAPFSLNMGGIIKQSFKPIIVNNNNGGDFLDMFKFDDDSKEDNPSYIRGDVESRCYHNNTKYELFISPKFSHKIISIKDETGFEFEIKVINPIEIMEAKMRYVIQAPKSSSGLKHKADILTLLTNL
jgi:hypothetical protein